MNAAVFTLTLRQIAGQRRSLLLFLLALVPVALVIIYRLSEHADQHEEVASFLGDFVVTAILPLACLILGTSALGSEIEDGTAVYILAKPVPRRHTITAKLAASVLVTAAFVVPATAVSGLIALQGVSDEGIVTGFAVASQASPELQKRIQDMAAAGQITTPQDVGNAVLFFASDISNRINGQVLIV